MRYPSSLNALVGVVATQGLVSRAGIVPLTFSHDRGGPMCRTVEDTAAVLEVLTGDDPRDAITAVAHGRQSVVYSNYTGRHERCYVARLLVRRKMAGIEDIRLGLRQVPLVGGNFGQLERRIIAAKPSARAFVDYLIAALREDEPAHPA